MDGIFWRQDSWRMVKISCEEKSRTYSTVLYVHGQMVGRIHGGVNLGYDAGSPRVEGCNPQTCSPDQNSTSTSDNKHQKRQMTADIDHDKSSNRWASRQSMCIDRLDQGVKVWLWLVGDGTMAARNYPRCRIGGRVGWGGSAPITNASSTRWVGGERRPNPLVLLLLS